MSRVLRLCFCFVVGLIFGGVGVAHAEAPVTQYMWNGSSACGIPGTDWGTPEATYAAWGASWPRCDSNWPGYSLILVSSSFVAPTVTYRFYSTHTYPVVITDSSGSFPSRQWCVLANSAPVGGVCGAPACPAAGSVVGTASQVYSVAGRIASGVVCIGSCVLTPGSSGSAKKTDGSWSSWALGPFTATGASCTATAIAQGSGNATTTPVGPADPGYSCTSKGKSFGVVNGVAVCLPANTSSSNSTSTSTPGGGGPASTTNVSNQTSCSGDGSCTTTTTTTTTSGGSGPGGTGDGSTTTTDTATDTKPQNDFCAENPKAVQCVGATDPCSEHPDRASCLNMGTPADDQGELTSRQVGTDAIFEVSVPSNASCPADQSLPHGWGVISYAPICTMAGWLKPFTLLFAWLLAGFFVIGAKTSE